MLQNIREKLTGTVAAVILGLIALSLVVTFGNIDTGFTPAGTALTVNGEDVPVSEFRSAYQQKRQEWEAQFRAQLPEDLARSMAESVIDAITRNRVLVQHVAEQGYRVSDAEVIRAIQENPVFQVGGRFSQPAYRQLLASQGYTEQRFEFEQRRNMQLQQFIEGIAYSAFFTPQEFRRYIALDGETRDVEYATFAPELWSADVEVSDEEIAARYEQDKALYKTTESVTLNYVELDYADLLDEVDVEDADVRRYYDEHRSEFQGPDQRQVSHILIAVKGDEAAAKARAQQVLDELAAGASFDSLAAKYSDDTGTAAAGGSLGWLGSGDAPAQEFEDAMFALQRVGDVSEPVRSEFGYHIIRLDGIRSGEVLPFAEVAADLKARLREEAAADRYAELLDELDERALESLDGLAPVAEAMQLELKTIPEFTRNGGGELGFVPALVDAVFSLEVLEDGENTPVIEIADGRAVVAHVEDYRPAEIRPFAEVRDEIRSQLIREEAIGLGARQVAELVRRLNAGESAGEVLAASGQTLNSVAGLRRGDATLPPDLTAAVFQAPHSGDGSGVFRTQLLGDGSYAIFRVVRATPGVPENFSQEDRDERKRQLALRLGSGQATGVIEALVSSADVEVAPDLLDSELGVN